MTLPDAFVFGPFRLLTARRELLAHDVPVAIGQRAFDVLLTLVDRHGQLVTKDELMAEVWPGVVVEENNLQVHISALRKLLDAASKGEKYLLTVAGRGYRFVAPVERESAPPSAASAAPASAAPAAAASAWNNLPPQLTPLIGREADLHEVAARLRQHRLVTLTGSGGVGKTRLAIEVGRGLLDHYADGVALVELAPLNDAQLVPVLIADVLDVKLRASETGELAAALKGKHVLLILDNCEHVITAAARVAEALMRGCPRLSVLASSRERLAIAGESVFRVPSLATPDTDTRLSAATAGECPAIRFFLDRAAAAGDGFALTDDNAPAVAAICRRLDGIPLAIELAVPRLKVLSPQQLGRGLDERFGLLTGGSRTALTRHQTLQALLAWSYDLLNEAEKLLLRRLSVFAGGTTRASMAAVVVDEGLADGQVLDLLSSLVEKSLVVAELVGDEPRYRLLESTRYYARDKSAALAEPDLRRRHARHLVDRLAAATTAWETTATDRWLARYGADIDNLRAALDWAFGPDGDAAIGLELVGSSHIIWAELGLMLEHRRWVEQGLRRRQGAPKKTVARLLSWQAGDVKDVDDATDYDDAMQAAALYRELGDAFLEGQMLLRAGTARLLPDRAEDGESLLRDAHALLRAHGPTKTLARCLSALASARLFAADIAGAQSFHAQALATYRDVAHGT